MRIADAIPQLGQNIIADAIRFAYVPSPPVILAQPVARTNVVGSTATFAVGVISSWPVAYLWRKDGLNLPGATNAQLIIPSVRAQDFGHYSVLAISRDGTVLSSPALLQVQLPALVVTRAFSNVVITWTGDGILQNSTNITGPYRDVPGAQGAYSNVLSAGTEFYRLRQ